MKALASRHPFRPRHHQTFDVVQAFLNAEREDRNRSFPRSLKDSSSLESRLLHRSPALPQGTREFAPLGFQFLQLLPNEAAGFLGDLRAWSILARPSLFEVLAGHGSPWAARLSTEAYRLAAVSPGESFMALRALTRGCGPIFALASRIGR